eukprot:COSAG02_NODE_2150_length_9660_cov_45.377889_12_plen_84_part_00
MLKTAFCTRAREWVIIAGDEGLTAKMKRMFGVVSRPSLAGRPAASSRTDTDTKQLSMIRAAARLRQRVLVTDVDARCARELRI